eukprot:scaffold20183_cov26-Prasinocladus_malaysianus.AAC.2
MQSRNQAIGLIRMLHNRRMCCRLRRAHMKDHKRHTAGPHSSTSALWERGRLASMDGHQQNQARQHHATIHDKDKNGACGSDGNNHNTNGLLARTTEV